LTGAGSAGVVVDLIAASGMITNAPPAGSAGVLESTPATRTWTGRRGAWLELSVTAPRPRSAAACGDTRTGWGAPTVPGVASSPAGTGGNPGVRATSAA
jgi:hypothetical protein